MRVVSWTRGGEKEIPCFVLGAENSNVNQNHLFCTLFWTPMPLPNCAKDHFNQFFLGEFLSEINETFTKYRQTRNHTKNHGFWSTTMLQKGRGISRGLRSIFRRCQLHRCFWTALVDEETIQRTFYCQSLCPKHVDAQRSNGQSTPVERKCYLRSVLRCTC